MGLKKQYFVSLGLILTTILACYFSVELIGYRVVALILLLVVSVLAMVFDIFPVLLAAVLSALTWNYFFIPPLFNFYIGTPQDALMFLMYFAIAMINIVLTFKIRQFEKKVREREEREKTIQLYNTLLNSLSHELRTPISTIIGSIDTIKENEKKLSPTTIRELFSEIEIASFRLNRQVENLLNMSRLEAGVLQSKPDWCDVNELVFSVIQHYKESVSQKIHFEADESMPLFRLDSGLMEQVLHNIIHNAIQYTPENSEIEIKAEQRNNGCRVTISDNGNGFPENEIQFAFDKFYRTSQTATGGTGLGLSIAKGFAEALNGNIKLKNKKAGGAEFTIEIPALSIPLSLPS